MASYYVSVGGDDLLDGLSWVNAWATLNKAATTAVAGDIVTFGDGTYNVGQGQAAWNGGAMGNPVVFRSAIAGNTIWKKSATGGTLIDLTLTSYVTIEGIIIDGDWTASAYTSSRMMELDDSAYINILDCTIQDGRGHGIAIFGNCNQILIEDTEVNTDMYNDGASFDGILLHYNNNTNVTIRGCKIHNTDHVGVYVNSCDGFVIEYTEIWDTHSHCLQFGSPGGGYGWTIDNCEARYCIIHGSEDYGPPDGQYHQGVYITGADVTAVNVIKCVIYDTDGSGIQLGNQVAGPFYIDGNTIHNPNEQGHNEQGCINMWCDVGNPTVYMRNNIFYSTRAAGWTVRIAGNYNANMNADYNLYYADPGASTDVYRGGVTYTTYAAYFAAPYEANSLRDTNPDFIDLPNDDYRLQAVSPAINQGTNIGEPWFGAAADIGAYEWRSTIYYVDDTLGNDANPGDIAQPWQTLTKVSIEFDRGHFSPGDSILLKRGETWTVTDGTDHLRLRGSSGSFSDHIYIGAYSAGARPIISGDGVTNVPLVTRYDGDAAANYITIEDLELTNWTDSGAVTCRGEGSYWHLIDLYIHTSTNVGAMAPGIYVYDNSHHVEIHDSEITACQGEGIYIGVDAVEENGDYTRRVVIRNCSIHDNYNEGIDITGISTSCFVVDCELEDNARGGAWDNAQIALGGRYHRLMNCRIEGTTLSNRYGLNFAYTYSGIGCRWIKVDRCLFKECGGSTGAAIRMRGDDDHLTNLTIVGGSGEGLEIQSNEYGTAQHVKNCIFDDIAGGNRQVYIVGTAALGRYDLDYNRYGDADPVWYYDGATRTFAWIQSQGKEASGSQTDPAFAEVVDYTLAGGSPCVNAGEAASTTWDWNLEYGPGAPSGAPDMGWSEVGWETPHRVFRTRFDTLGDFSYSTGVTCDPAAAYYGTNGGLITIFSTASKYVERDGLGDVDYCYARLYFNADNLTMASGDVFKILELSGANGVITSIWLYYSGANKQVFANILGDIAPQSTGLHNISAGWNQVEIFWMRSPYPSHANWGELILFLNHAEIDTITGYNNDVLGSVHTVRAGAVADLDAGTSGQLFIDMLCLDEVREIGDALDPLGITTTSTSTTSTSTTSTSTSTTSTSTSTTSLSTSTTSLSTSSSSTSTTSLSTSSSSTSTTSLSTSTTSLSTSSSTTSLSTSTTSLSTSTTSTSISTSTSLSTSLSTSTTSTSISTSTSLSTSSSTTSTSTTTTSTSTTTTSSSTSTTSSSTSTTTRLAASVLAEVCLSEHDQILIPVETTFEPAGTSIPDGYRPYNVLDLWGMARRMLRQYSGFGLSPLHFITQRGPYQDGDTPLSMRLDPRVIQLVIAETLYRRMDYWDRRGTLLDLLRANRSFGDTVRPLIYRKWLAGGKIERGHDLVTTAWSTTVTSASGRFIQRGLQPGARFDITTGLDAGLGIVATVPNDYTVTLTAACANTATGVGWAFRRGWGIRDLYALLEVGPTGDEGPRGAATAPTGYKEVLRLIAHDPAWYGPEQSETWDIPAATADLVFDGAGGYFDVAGRWLFAAGFIRETVDIVYWGTIGAKPTIVVEGPASYLMIENTTTDVRIELDYEIVLGETVTINTLDLTVTSDVEGNLMPWMSGDLATFTLEPDPQAPNRSNSVEIRFNKAQPGTSSAVLYWRNRYIGI